AIADGDARDRGADGDDLTRKLVTEDLRVLGAGERVRLDRRNYRAGDVLVEVGSTDPAGRDPKQDIPADRRRRLGDVLDPEISRGVEPERLHGTIRPLRSRSKRSVNDVWVSRTPMNPSRLLSPMSVNVSTVRPRSASVCHHEASVSTGRSRRPWRLTIRGQISP